MGVGKKLPLPAPTESTILQPSGDDIHTDLATNISRRTDRTSYSIPEDGSPITVSTVPKGDKSAKSQTSLLIEYFEGGKGPNTSARPSVRVKVTPSAGKKGKEIRDHIQITESVDGRKPSYSKRISLPSRGGEETHTIESENNSASSLAEDSLGSRRPPIEIEVMHKDQDSDLSDRRYTINPSEISSMPPDSMLEEEVSHERKESGGLAKAALAGTAAAIGTAAAADAFKVIPRRRSRSLSRERVTKKVIEKLGQDAAAKSKHKSKSSSRSPSVSQEYLSETLSSPRRRSSKHRKLEEPSEVSGVTDSQVSATSYRSDTSKYSVTNPKLLQAVEDSIRRLILPEINAIKAQQKRESLESTSKGDSSRRISKHSEGSRSREGSLKKRRSRASDKYENSASEKSFDHGRSQETVIHDANHKHRRRSKESSKLKDAALGAAVGGLLTHAALQHHESSSSIDRRERRRMRSKSHSRSQSNVSAAETEEIFNKHDVAPMPMRSELTNSDFTRDSILSEQTSTGSFEHRQAEIREIARVSPKQIYASGRKKTKSPSGLRHAESYEDHIAHEEEHSHHSESYDASPQKHHFGEDALAAGAAGAGLLGAYHAYNQHQAPTLGPGRYALGRSLSPIQSVASYEEGGMSRHNSQRKTHSTGSLSSLNKQHEAELAAREVHEDELNYKKQRPLGINLESRSEVLVGQDIKSPTQVQQRHLSHGSWFEGDEDQQNRNSGTSYESSRVPIGRLTQYTDDSMDAPYLDRVTAQEVHEGAEGNAHWVHTPIAVESAVASLLEPSVLDAQSVGSGMSYTKDGHFDSTDGHHRDIETTTGYVDSPLKQAQVVDYDDHEHYETQRNVPRKGHIERSPRQSPPHSTRDRDSIVPVMRSNAMPDLNDPMPEIISYNSKQDLTQNDLKRDVDSKSDISTNPPDIQGPKKYDSPMHWPYHGTSPQAKVDQIQTSSTPHDNSKAMAATILGAAAATGAAAAINHQHRKAGQADKLDRKISVEDYGTVAQTVYPGDGYVLTSPYLKDEGYETNVPNRSPGVLTPDHRRKGVTVAGPKFAVNQDDEDDVDEEDVFGGVNLKRISGNSHGMPPLYDGATGDGRDRIDSKDIIALMDHLAVRDAQRNARDTEILTTLVKSAAEMRNSFEEVKRFIADQDNMLIAVGNKQHEKTQRVIGGPRPQPARTPKRVNSNDSMIEDIPPKRRNMLRRALKGLSGKNSNDLTKIEDMLHHLLEEVADLKAAQQVTAPASIARGPGLSSYEQLRDMPEDMQDGYEPEGVAGTGSADHSGHFSPDFASGQENHTPGQDRRRASARNRISTVMEEHEEDEPLTPSEQRVLNYDNTEQLLTPTGHRQRGNSVPLGTPPRIQQEELPKSVENTPRTDKSRKHKSSSSSIFPKISRWSKTTASTIPEPSGRPYANASTSGVDITNYDVTQHYDPEGDDRLRSAESLGRDRPPSPLIPSEVSRLSEDPTYHAHRDSINLQHPRPQQGSTARFKNHLESQARDLSSPVSPSSDHFGSNPVLARYNHGGAGNRNSGGGNLSPISDVNTASATGPARPPKIRDDGPLIPPKIPLDTTSPSQSGNRKQTFLSRSAAGQGLRGASLSPRPVSSHGSLSPVPTRKPTGPRPITSSGSYTPDKVSQLQRNRYRGSPNAIDVDSEVEVIEAMRRGELMDEHPINQNF